MNVIEYSAAIALASAIAGLLGALTGLGGGVVIVPVLCLLFGVNIRYAIGASLVSVIATSSGAASAYVRDGLTNIRVGIVLEVATCLGTLTGAFLATHLSTSAIAVVFGLALLYSAWVSATKKLDEPDHGRAPDRIASWLDLDGTYPSSDGIRAYQVRNVPIGFGLMGIAGILSGLLGIGSGAVKVLAMDHAMNLPFKVSTTTSNFMIGVTAAASAGVYLSRGYIDPGLSMPVILGVLAGSIVGARILAKAGVRGLRILFSIVVAVLGFQMVFKGLTGGL
jgi:uncharacterized membrane protein YfcA